MRRLVCTGTLLLACACAGSLTQPTSQVNVRTDRASYSDTGIAIVTVQLVSGRAVALNGCPRPPAIAIQRVNSGQWTDAGSIGVSCLAVETPSTISLEPGGTVEGSLGMPWLAAGTYRLVVLVGPDRTSPDFTVASNVFDVH